MKLSKALLGAILVGITIQTSLSSCKKNDKDNPTPKSPTEQNANQQPDSCPACGMG